MSFQPKEIKVIKQIINLIFKVYSFDLLYSLLNVISTTALALPSIT